MGEFYKMVPKDLDGNLRHRVNIKGMKDQAGVKAMCRADPLFWLNTFGWIYEPRPPRGPIDIPFITWPCQDEAFLLMNQCIDEGRDLVAVKSRDMGYTWTLLALFLWRWQFLPLQSLALCSRVDESVEQTGNPDTLFWKLDMLISRQPKWLVPKFTRLKKRLLNDELRCDIKGYATTNDIARGGRRTAIGADEFAAFEYNQGHDALAAMQGAANCVVTLSTPQGQRGAFYDQWVRSKAGGYHRKVVGHRLHWTEHPYKRPGLYTTRDGVIEVLDKEYVFPDDYPFRLDVEGKPRSPAYDAESERKSDQYMAQEWDMDFAGAGSAFFQTGFLEKLREQVREPLRVGRLSYDEETLEPKRWYDDPKGNIKLWVPLIGGRPAPGLYAAGHDVSAGTGATPSVACLGDVQTGDQVCEYADARRAINDFARDSVALSKWFHNARMIWETNGPGVTFSREVLNSTYRHLYLKKTNEFGLASKPTDSPGLGMNRQVKREVMESFRDALGSDFSPKSEALIDDAAGYEYSQGGGVDHKSSRTTEDNSAASENHGDRVIAAALCWKVIRDAKRSQGKRASVIEPKRVALPGSVAWIIEQERLSKADSEMFGGLNL